MRFGSDLEETQSRFRLGFNSMQIDCIWVGFRLDLDSIGFDYVGVDLDLEQIETIQIRLDQIEQTRLDWIGLDWID